MPRVAFCKSCCLVSFLRVSFYKEFIELKIKINQIKNLIKLNLIKLKFNQIKNLKPKGFMQLLPDLLYEFYETFHILGVRHFFTHIDWSSNIILKDGNN